MLSSTFPCIFYLMNLEQGRSLLEKQVQTIFQSSFLFLLLLLRVFLTVISTVLSIVHIKSELSAQNPTPNTRQVKGSQAQSGYSTHIHRPKCQHNSVCGEGNEKTVPENKPEMKCDIIKFILRTHKLHPILASPYLSVSAAIATQQANPKEKNINVTNSAKCLNK